MPLCFLRIPERLIGGEVVEYATFRDVVFTHHIHSVYVFLPHVA